MKLPREADLGLHQLKNRAGITIAILPAGFVFTIEHRHALGTTTINQVLGSPLAGAIGRLNLRIVSPGRQVVQIVGPSARVRTGGNEDRFVWEGETEGLAYRATLLLDPINPMWLWRLDVRNARDRPVACDALLIQDLGLGDRGFVMGNEAYASHYIDHCVVSDPECGPIVMSRQNLSQSGRHPWIMHGCLEGAAGFATDGLQLFGPRNRDASDLTLDSDLPSQKLQHEMACVGLRSHTVEIAPHAGASWSFFAVFDPDHPEASQDADLRGVATARRAASQFADCAIETAAPPRSLVQGAAIAKARSLTVSEIEEEFPQRRHEEHVGGELASFFTPDGRHVVLRDKERLVTRRHGAILRSGSAMLPDTRTACVTCWMHGVFGAQLTIGNTSLHKLFSVSRDPYNIVRGGGLRMLVESGEGWVHLAVPSAFEIGLSACRWIYRLDDRRITIEARAHDRDPCVRWTVASDPPSRFLVFGEVVLGERELESAGEIDIDEQAFRSVFRPDPESLWGQRYPHAACVLIAGQREAIDAIGGDALLDADEKPRGGPFIAVRTRPTSAFSLTVTASLENEPEAMGLGQAATAGAPFEAGGDHWRRIIRAIRLEGRDDVAAHCSILPWFAHDAMVHLSVPHGLEQYTGGAWGTRDVCQGPVELLLALEHDEPVKEILRIVFAQQYEATGDWPQWFMLEPYSFIQEKRGHGDVIVWPLKALCDYVERSGDLAFLDEPVAWRRDDSLDRTERKTSLADHVAKLVATLKERFVPGTSLVRLGEGDWNDSLQPADPRSKDWMVSAWTVTLLVRQLERYAWLQEIAGSTSPGEELRALAARMIRDLRRYLLRDGTLAGYALFDPTRSSPLLLLHPTDALTGVRYSLLPMVQSIIGRLFDPEEERHHLAVIRDELTFPDGVRLMDRPLTYRGGIEHLFQRAESSAFFGREIGLMYVHAHLRYCEALAAVKDADGLWEALRLTNPILAGDIPLGRPRQRNTYFTSSDAVFRDRYEASTRWADLRAGRIATEGGWRIYSSGPGLFVRLLLEDVLGLKRHLGKRSVEPLLPRSVGHVTVSITRGDREEQLSISPE